MMKLNTSLIRISFVLVLSITGIFTSTHQLFGQLSLNDCYEMARNNYPLILQLDLIEQSKGYTVSNANKSFLPQLNINLIGGVIDGLPTFGGASESGSAEFNLISTVQFNQAIWDGGTTKANKQIIESNSAIERSNLEATLYELEDRVNNLFFGVLLISEQIGQLEIFKENLSRNQKQIEIAVENGTAFRSDTDEIQVEILLSDQKISVLEFNQHAYLSVLSVLIGQEIGSTETLIKPELDIEYANLPISRPELKVFANQEYFYKAQFERQRSILYPKIGLTAMGVFITPGVGFGNTELQRVLLGGLSVSWDIGGLYRQGNNKNLMEINLQKVNNQRETFVFNTNLELTRIREEIRKYSTLMNRDKQILELQNRITTAYQVKFDNGVTTMSELLDKANEENIARQNLITHELQYQMALYAYQNTSGN